MHQAPRVFIVQMPGRSIDLAPAMAFGRLQDAILTDEPQLLLPAGVRTMCQLLRNGLADYKSSDSLLLVGNPIAMGMATVFASEASPDGCVRFLKWHRDQRIYSSVLIDTITN